MPVSRFRSLAPCSRTRSTPKGPPPASAEALALLDPGVRRKHHASASPLGRLEPTQASVLTAWRSLGEQAHRKDRLRDLAHRSELRLPAPPDLSRKPKLTRRTRFATSKSKRTPIPRAAGPSGEGKPSPSTRSQHRDRSEPRSWAAGSRRSSKLLRRDPFRGLATEANPDLSNRRIPAKARSPRSNPYGAGPAEACPPPPPPLARGAGPSLASEG